MIDWNFCFSVITAAAAIIALLQTSHQTKLSNKQYLFDRRLRVYTVVQGLLRLYEEHRGLLDSNKNEPQFAIDFDFLWLTNNTFMQQHAHAISHPLENPYHQDFLKKQEELRQIAEEIPLIFTGKEATAYSRFVVCYEQLLFRMYQYQIALNRMKEANEKHPMAIEQANSNTIEPRLRKQLFSAVDEIEEAYQVIDKKHLECKIKKQIRLV